jgi:bla regulator protein blaR1
MLALCALAVNVSPGHPPDIPILDAPSGAPATDRKPKPGTHLPTDESSHPRFKVPQRTIAALTQIGSAATTPPSKGAAAAAAPTLACTLPESAPTKPKPELLLFHLSGPLPSYEVATIKPLDPNTASDVVRLPPGGSLSPLSIRRYIMDAYGALYPPQIVGGPDWLNKDAYVINGKVPDDLGAAFQKMTREDHTNQNRMMQQCLLADRFHLKAHFETRTLPVYELVPAKGGLKITEVPAPPEHKPGDPPLQPRPGDSLAPGSMMTTPNSNGLRVLNGRAIKMQLLTRVIGGDVGDRPIVDHTGFTGYFDITDLTWAPLGDAAATSQPDVPSLPGALEGKLGLRLVPAEDPIEILVIDRIERPTPN